MSIKMLGVDFRHVDVTAMHELGMTVLEVEGGQGTVTKTYFPNGITTATTDTIYKSGSKRYQYCRADAAIAQYDAVARKLDETDAPFAVIKTAAATSHAIGICEATGVAADYYFWLTIGGYVPIANVEDASAQGDVLGAGATAGRLTTPTFTTTAATLTQLNAGVRAAITGIIAVTDGSASNLAGVYYRRRIIMAETKDTTFDFLETDKPPTEEDVISALLLNDISEKEPTIKVLQERKIDNNNVVRSVKEIPSE